MYNSLKEIGSDVVLLASQIVAQQIAICKVKFKLNLLHILFVLKYYNKVQYNKSRNLCF